MKEKTHASILVWEIPWTEDPGGLEFIGSQRVEHNWETEHEHKTETEHETFMIWKKINLFGWIHLVATKCPNIIAITISEHSFPSRYWTSQECQNFKLQFKVYVELFYQKLHVSQANFE